MPKPVVDMTPKVDRMSAAWAAGDRLGALRIASRFHDRTPETRTFKRGWDAHSNPAFYRQLGRDPDAMVRDACSALAAKFGLPC